MCSIINPASCWHCTARQCCLIKQNFLECPIFNPALSLLMKHLVNGQLQKPPKSSAFYWSSYASLVFIGHKGSTFTETGQNDLTYHIGRLITVSDRTGPDLILSYFQPIWKIFRCPLAYLMPCPCTLVDLMPCPISG